MLLTRLQKAGRDRPRMTALIGPLLVFCSIRWPIKSDTVERDLKTRCAPGQIIGWAQEPCCAPFRQFSQFSAGGAEQPSFGQWLSAYPFSDLNFAEFQFQTKQRLRVGIQLQG